MLEILNTAIAVAAGAHNPSILHPSFLVAQDIVPRDWELAESPICTPVLSVVKFSNGIVITVEAEKMQVIHNAPPPDPLQSELPGIVQRYTRTLPHVRYSGVGINVSGLVETNEADVMLRRFLAPGPWNEGPLQAQSMGVRFVYHALDTQLRLAMDGGTVKPAGERPARAGIVIVANYHADVPQGTPDQVEIATRRFGDCCAHFRDVVATILQLQTEHVTH